MSARTSVDRIEGETGGTWFQETLECSSCAGTVVHDVMEKIGSVRESWCIAQVPKRATAVTKLHCPECDAHLMSASPAGTRPSPATSFQADRPARATRQTEYLCSGCEIRYILDERVEVSWLRAETSTAIASPRPYPRTPTER